MSKITLTDLVNLQNETTAVNAINSNNTVLETALDNTLSRDGTSPNKMGATLDMNSNRIINLPQPVSLFEPLRLLDANTLNGGGSIPVSALPPGGTATQLLTKNSATNFDASWQDIPGTGTTVLDTMVSMRALAPGAYDNIVLRGYYAKGDGGGGNYYWNSTSTSTDNSGTIIQPNIGGTGRWIAYTDTNKTVTPEMFGAKGDGTTNDGVAVQAWATYLSDGGVGICTSKLGYATAQTILFQPTTNVEPVVGPKIVGNLKLIGHASLPINNDLLQIYNPTTFSPTQNFYFADFDSIEVSGTTGTGNGVSIRGYWGKIGKILGRDVNDVVQFPNFMFGGVPDEYESNPHLGDITGLNYRGYVYNNLVGLGATPRAGNVRGSISGLASGLGCINASGSEHFVGDIVYSGKGWACTINRPPVPGIQSSPHEVYMQGCGDVDACENGFNIINVEHCTITGHRLNVEPPGFAGVGPSWPLTAYRFGNGGTSPVIATTVNCYITIRPGVTAANMGTLFDFTNENNINGLTINAQIDDGSGASLLTTVPFTTLYKNINPNASIKIVENGIVRYDTTNLFVFSQLPAAAASLVGVTKIVRDSTTSVQAAVIAGGGGNVVLALCNGTNWIVA